jgi:hypothetical protein
MNAVLLVALTAWLPGGDPLPGEALPASGSCCGSPAGSCCGSAAGSCGSESWDQSCGGEWESYQESSSGLCGWLRGLCHRQAACCECCPTDCCTGCVGGSCGADLAGSIPTVATPPVKPLAPEPLSPSAAEKMPPGEPPLK